MQYPIHTPSIETSLNRDNTFIFDRIHSFFSFHSPTPRKSKGTMPGLAPSSVGNHDWNSISSFFFSKWDSWISNFASYSDSVNWISPSPISQQLVSHRHTELRRHPQCFRDEKKKKHG
jgi:hypothetical protein